jgi:hypothetical protein
VLADGGVRDVGQAEFAEEAALFVLGKLAAFGDGEETVEREFERLFPENFGLEGFADERCSGAEDGSAYPFRT